MRCSGSPRRVLIGQYARVPSEDDLVAATPVNPVGSPGDAKRFAYGRMISTVLTNVCTSRTPDAPRWKLSGWSQLKRFVPPRRRFGTLSIRLLRGSVLAIPRPSTRPWTSSKWIHGASRSGYAKELLLRRMGGRTLSPTQVARLAGIGRSWVDGPPRREFRDLCRVATRQVPELRSWALTRLGAGEARERLHALWLFTAFPLTDLTDAEITLVQRSLVEFVGGDRERWRHGEWLEYVARAVVTDDWQEQLQRSGLDADHPG